MTRKEKIELLQNLQSGEVSLKILLEDLFIRSRPPQIFLLGENGSIVEYSESECWFPQCEEDVVL